MRRASPTGSSRTRATRRSARARSSPRRSPTSTICSTTSRRTSRRRPTRTRTRRRQRRRARRARSPRCAPSHTDDTHCPAPLLDSASLARAAVRVGLARVCRWHRQGAPRLHAVDHSLGARRLHTPDSPLPLAHRQSDDHAPCSGRDGQPQDDHDRHAEGLRLRLRLALVAQALLAQRALLRLHLPHRGERGRRGVRLLLTRL